jgi:hypothetical protein
MRPRRNRAEAAKANRETAAPDARGQANLRHLWISASSENQRLLAPFTWVFPVMTFWGSAPGWLPVFFGLENPGSRLRVAALLVTFGAVGAALVGLSIPATVLFLTRAALSGTALHGFRGGVRPP